MEEKQTAHCIAAQVASGNLSCVQSIERTLAKTRLVQSVCNPFTCLIEEEAQSRAQRMDESLLAGLEVGLLQGVPICIKDMTPTKGHPTTRGSWTSGDGKADYDAVVVQRLKTAGAIIVAKTTTAELAFSSFTRSDRYGPTFNPWDLSRTAGGSSGGSAVAVATGVVPLAEGTDMGGSVRIPAAACGVVGFKPSLGRIPMDIVPSALETVSHFGPLASCVEDAALFVAATAGHHASDMLSQTSTFDLAKTGRQDLAGRRIALSIDLGYCQVAPEIEAALISVAEMLQGNGSVVETVSLPWSREVYDQWAIRWNCLLALFPNTETEAELAMMDPALARCIRSGRNTSAMELMRTEVLRTRLNAQLNAIFENYDALICPTNAVPAPSLDQCDSDYEVTLKNGKFKAFDMAHPFNMVPSSPVLSLPVGLTSDQLPIGMQIVGKPYADEETLALAASIEAIVGQLPPPKIQKI